MIDLPASPGAYLLELYLPDEVSLTIGRLGRASFPAGVMFYAGSAQGPGGLKARLGRHLQLRGARPLRWHIDYLRCVAQVCAFAYLASAQIACAARLECLWSQALARLPGSSVPLSGFGASDCGMGCPAHLIAFAGEKKSRLPLLFRAEWLQILEHAAGASLTIARSPG
jgi:Uri superfamily endonuclease